MTWQKDFYESVTAKRTRFNSIYEVARFLDIDTRWTPPHIGVWEKLRKKHGSIQIMASVGHLKSNWLFLEIAKELFNNINTQILFGAETDTLAKHMTLRLQNALTCSRAVEEFGDLEGKIWSSTELWLNGRNPYLKGPSFFSAGVTTAIEGFRPRHAFTDDITSLKKSISNAFRFYEKEWVDMQFMPRIDWQRGATYTGAGSRWHPDDVYNYLETQHNIPTFNYPAHNEDYTEFLWPEEYNKSVFTNPEQTGRRDTTPEPRYQMRYLCNPRGMMGDAFKPEWFQVIERKDIPFDNLVVKQAWDPAITEADIVGKGHNKKDQPDFTAGITVGFDKRTGNYYIFDLWISRIASGHDEVVFQQYLKWKDRVNLREVVFEAVLFQKYIYNVLRKLPIPIDKVVSHATDKITRILNLEPYFRNGRMFIVSDLPFFTEFYDEYISYPTQADHDDILDALEICMKRFTSGGAASLGKRMSWL